MPALASWMGVEDQLGHPGQSIETPYSTFSTQPCYSVVLLLLTLLTLSTLLSNSLLLLVTLLSQRKRRGVDHLAIINLSLNGVLASLFVMAPSLANIYGHSNVIGSYCKVLGFFTSLLLFNSVITSLLITTERFVQVAWPLATHRDRRSSGLSLRAGAAISLLIGWMVSLAIAVVPLTSHGPPSFTFDPTSLHCWHDLRDRQPASRSYVISALVLGVVFPTAGILGIHMLVYRVARRVERCEMARRALIPIPNCPQATRRPIFSKAAKTLLLAATVFVSFIMPETLVQLIYITTYYKHQDEHLDSPVSYRIACLWVSFMGYVLNPMLYGLLNRNLRKQVVYLLKLSPPGSAPRSPFIAAILRRSATFRSSNSNLSRLSVSPIFNKSNRQIRCKNARREMEFTTR
ncbi:melatonin receptor type 1B-B-like isoform X2 [Varroa destructor]|uniref:G-protein coupled receptors family 1 profile domain-containing protein n=1 Tax=Varroa destructor TaxID=109461 RepID=A0A7M7JC79_VARDE|nr:melatonin receptor type 1B-B-like isoform X2 [Varroa destructor]